jgi:hypothetical protein
MAHRVFILGSVVSRDTLDVSPEEFRVAGYLARTSMAGIGLPAVGLPGVRESILGTLGPEQQRMIFNDFDKETLRHIGKVESDVVLLDFIEERFDLCLTENSLFSNTSELRRVMQGNMPHPTLKSGSDSFFSLWLAGFERLMTELDGKHVVLNRVFWAEKFPDGEDAGSRGWILHNNAVLQRLYELVDRYWTIPVIDYPRDIWIADPDHRWGRAPYHYTSSVYAHGAGALKRLRDQARQRAA